MFQIHHEGRGRGELYTDPGGHTVEEQAYREDEEVQTGDRRGKHFVVYANVWAVRSRAVRGHRRI